MKRKLLVIPLVLLLAISSVAIGCECGGGGGGAISGESEPEYGGTLIYRASFIDIVTDPGDPRSAQYGPWLETLFTMDRTVPVDEYGFEGTWTAVEYRAGQLAESWEYKDGDPTTIVVHLHEGVKWTGTITDGREFTSDDVVYTFDMVMGAGEFAGSEPDAVFFPLIPYIEEVVATDDYTVEFHLTSTSPFAAENVISTQMDIAMRPREWYDLTDEQKADWHYVAGTGPFVITDFVSGTSMTCDANDDYYQEDGRYGNQLPYVDALKVLVVPDMDTALAALRTGEIDILSDARVFPTLSQTQALMQTNPEINVYNQLVASPGMFYAWDTETGTILPPFDDINVRIAMQKAINNPEIAETFYQSTVDGVLQGLMAPQTGWGYPFDEWPAELQEEYTYDLEEAKALMANAGVTSIDVEVLTTPDDYPEVLEIWQAYLKEIGVNITINAMDMMSQRPVVQQGDFEVLWTGATGAANNAPPDAIQSFYSQKFERTGQAAGVVDAGYDAIVERLIASTDVEEMKEIFREADLYWLERHWMAIGFPTLSYQMTQPWIGGYEGQALWSLGTWTYFSHMWIDSDVMTEYLGEVRE